MATKTKAHKITNRNTHGNCFQLAAKAFLGLTAPEYWRNVLEVLFNGFKPTKVELVHGFPRQPIPGGVRIAHAWIECRMQGRPVVIDLGGGRKVNPTIHDPSRYYRLGRMKPEECHRHKDAKTVCQFLAAERGTWGPWRSIPFDVVMPGYRGPRH